VELAWIASCQMLVLAFEVCQPALIAVLTTGVSFPNVVMQLFTYGPPVCSLLTVFRCGIYVIFKSKGVQAVLITITIIITSLVSLSAARVLD
jgi:hypothetical protein